MVPYRTQLIVRLYAQPNLDPTSPDVFKFGIQARYLCTITMMRQPSCPNFGPSRMPIRVFDVQLL